MLTAADSGCPTGNSINKLLTTACLFTVSFPHYASTGVPEVETTVQMLNQDFPNQSSLSLKLKSPGRGSPCPKIPPAAAELPDPLARHSLAGNLPLLFRWGGLQTHSSLTERWINTGEIRNMAIAAFHYLPL